MGRRAGALIVAMVVCLVAVPPASAQTGPVTSVIGGESASISEFPFMARISAREGVFRIGCSGTVVAPNMILTAAHCLLNESKTAYLEPATFEVLTGTSNLAIPGVVSHAERLVIDPNYKSSGALAGWHDAGLIQLSAPITAPAVKLATSQIWGAGTLGYDVGWGLTEAEGELPTEMQVGETVVQKQAYCEQEIGAEFHPLAELCSIDYPSYESSVCHGDSGGPMLIVSNHELLEIGIASFVTEEGCPTDSPQVHTRADAEAAWVAGEVAAHPPKTTTPPVPTTTTPAATAVVPKLPTLTLGSAKRDLMNILRTDRRLAVHFRGHVLYHASCRSTGTTSAQCSGSWRVSALRYQGIVQIFEEWEGATPAWNYHYWIHRTDQRCLSRSRHLGRCPHSLFHA
jgi:hypothetical protein